jgi:hypothetical protein
MGITDRSSVRAEVTGGGRSGGGGGGGQEAAEGARLVTHASCGGCEFFYSRDGNEDVRASGRVGRPDGSISVQSLETLCSLQSIDECFCVMLL